MLHLSRVLVAADEIKLYRELWTIRLMATPLVDPDTGIQYCVEQLPGR